MAIIAVIDDDADLLFLLEEMLHDRGWTVSTHRDVATALTGFRKLRPDLIISDLRLGTIRGWAGLESILHDSLSGEIPVIVCSGAMDELQRREGWLKEHGIVVLHKPFDLDELYSCVESALERQHAVAEH